jgi:3'-phosphoadenosine 5'-phosphosulfate sulfotransferase (PAPS reductase)/FAD synthetase
MPTNIKTCTRCILPDTFPGISFDEEGLCIHCRHSLGKETKLAEDKKRYEEKFLDLLKQTGVHASQRAYDILMAYSGGKDSTYTMGLLRNKYGLRVLAVSLDNGFVSDAAVTNIRNVTEALNVDHIFFKPRWDLLKTIFAIAADRDLYSKKTLERASTICTSCISLVKTVCLKTAIEMDIPMIGYGWSPGQAPVQSSIMKTNPSLVKMSQQAVLVPLREVAGEDIEAYFLQEKHYALADRFPYNVHPMAWEFYHEASLVEEIGKLGWTAPKDTDSNSTNCLLNAFGNDVHIKRLGFHPYAWEIANMVRDGVMTREEGYEKIYAEQDPRFIQVAKKKLGL